MRMLRLAAYVAPGVQLDLPPVRRAPFGSHHPAGHDHTQFPVAQMN